MSFSSLPPELVRQIIESTVLRSYRFEFHKERQQTLCSLSLVSKLFRSIAQPLLFEIVNVKFYPDEQMRPITLGSGGVARAHGLVRWLIVDTDVTLGMELLPEEKAEEDRFPETLRVFETVTTLTVGSIARRTFKALLTLTSQHLTYLQISSTHLVVSSLVRLPNLRYLTLGSVLPEVFSALVDPASVPNLRNLAIVYFNRDHLGSLGSTKLDLLLPQLDTLTVPARIWLDPRAALLRSAAPRTLVEYLLEDSEQLDLSATCPMHVRLRHLSLASPENQGQPQPLFYRWSLLILRNPSLPLQTIYLDSSHAPFGAVPEVTLLIRLCLDRKITVVFEPLATNLRMDPYISRDFAERQEEQKRKESGLGKRVSRSAG